MGESARDHDATVRLTAELAALDRLMQDRFVERDKAISAAYDESTKTVDRLNQRLNVLIEAQGTFMPRQETKLLIDALGARLDTVQKGLGDLANTIASLRSSLAGQTSGSAAAERRVDRSRSIVFGVIAAAATIINVVITLSVLHK